MTETLSMTTRTISDSFGTSTVPAALKKTDNSATARKYDNDRIELSDEALQLAKHAEKAGNDSIHQQKLSPDDNNTNSNLIYRSDSYGNIYATESGKNNITNETIVSGLSSPYDTSITDRPTSTSQLEASPATNSNSNWIHNTMQINLNSMTSEIKEKILPDPVNSRNDNSSRNRNSQNGYKRYSQAEKSTAIKNYIGTI